VSGNTPSSADTALACKTETDGEGGGNRQSARSRRIDHIKMCRQSDGMTRTQIQLPDDAFARAKKLCEAREPERSGDGRSHISLAELARRGIEYIRSVYTPEPDANHEWQPPKPRNLGWKGLSHAEIKAEAQLTSSEIRLTRRAKKYLVAA
jgi:hypothetical protein